MNEFKYTYGREVLCHLIRQLDLLPQLTLTTNISRISFHFRNPKNNIGYNSLIKTFMTDVIESSMLNI